MKAELELDEVCCWEKVYSRLGVIPTRVLGLINQ